MLKKSIIKLKLKLLTLDNGRNDHKGRFERRDIPKKKVYNQAKLIGQESKRRNNNKITITTKAQMCK